MQLEFIRADDPITKRCPKCGLEKSTTDFPRRDRTLWRPCAYCLPCQREYSRAHYRQNKSKHNQRRRANQKVYISRNRALMNDYLRARGCVDCGNSNPVVLEFDHVRGSKRWEVSTMINAGFSWDRIMQEVAKCDIRCANCHRIRTAHQFNWKGRILGYQERNGVGR